MTDETMLAMLKIDLGITTTAYDQRLAQYIETAKAEIEREGVTLSADSATDGNLVIQYAAWMWRKRDTGDGMPRMLRWQLNCRLFDVSGGEQNG
jgi:hypothetical protein